MSRLSSFQPQNIRNVVLLGQGGSGKTSLAEALLHRCGTITRMGTVEDANTTADFEPEAREHHHSTNSSLLFATYQGREINLLDTPGHPDFVGYALAALPAAETAILVVNAATGIEFNTRRLFLAAGEMGLARMVVINKMDANPRGLEDLVGQLRATFGASLHCINLPSHGGKDVVDCFDEDSGASDFGDVRTLHKEILESSVEVDDVQLGKYLAGEKLSLAELRKDFVHAMAIGHVVPVAFTSARNGTGVDDLLHILVEEAPSPLSARPRKLLRNGQRVEVPCDPEKPLLAQVLKVTDPLVGQLCVLRLLQGRLEAGTMFVCGEDKKPRRAGHIMKVEGREHPELESVAYAGDLVALARMEDIHVGQIIHDPAVSDTWAAILPPYPTPMTSLAVAVKNRQDEMKLSLALQRLKDEDPTLRADQDPATNELILSGLGDVHLRVIMEKLRNRHRLDLVTKRPSVAYRESITQRAEGHYRHRKQSGGAGQFGEVFLRVEPRPRGAGFQFANEVFGGAIPTAFISSVEKGIQDAMQSGVLAGFPVVDIKVTVYDGKSHPVDSKDIAFRTAGAFALRDALTKARPILLEPVVNLEVVAPEACTGDVTGHMKSHRGRVLGMAGGPAGTSVIQAQAPLAELGQFAAQLRSMTAGQGRFSMEYAHHDVAPAAVQQRMASERKSQGGADPA